MKREAPSHLSAQERIIIALDVPNRNDAIRLAQVLGERATFFKVGLELFSSEGPEIVKELRERGKRVFVDLKLFDIPRTVERAAARLAGIGASFITVHTLAGEEVLRGAALGVKSQGSCRALGVTILTSVADAGGQLGDQVVRLARQAKEAGLDGVISAVSEARRIKSECGADFLVVTPGIRLKALEKDDQKRSATAEEACREGADFIVVGRPITDSPDPRRAFEEICESMKGVSGPGS
jgi:orotidine-5'-phosphate decarboxylase